MSDDINGKFKLESFDAEAFAELFALPKNAAGDEVLGQAEVIGRNGQKKTFDIIAADKDTGIVTFRERLTVQ